MPSECLRFWAALMRCPASFEVVHRLFEDAVLVGHEKSIRIGILRSLDCFDFSRKRAEYELERKEKRAG
jgi:hypothetical protein